jgi:MEMO1 family protein
MQTTRKPQFAGTFYPKQAIDIANLLQQIVSTEAPDLQTLQPGQTLIGGIVPHAGYAFSGFQAVHFFNLVKQSEISPNHTFVFVNPNHTGQGVGDVNSCGFNFWEIPTGRFEVDTQLAEAGGLTPFELAHTNEHATEVLLPMLGHFHGFSNPILPITMNRQNPEVAAQLAQMLTKAAQTLGRSIVFVASSDFSHYEAPETGFMQDQFLVDAILDLNSKEIFAHVKQHHITACGYGPIMALIEFAKTNHHTVDVELLKRGHSGQVMPSKQVVDYISFALLHKSIAMGFK